jgi:hypothetical protein
MTRPAPFSACASVACHLTPRQGDRRADHDEPYGARVNYLHKGLDLRIVTEAALVAAVGLGGQYDRDAEDDQTDLPHDVAQAFEQGRVSCAPLRFGCLDRVNDLGLVRRFWLSCSDEVQYRRLHRS